MREEGKSNEYPEDSEARNKGGIKTRENRNREMRNQNTRTKVTCVTLVTIEQAAQRKRKSEQGRIHGTRCA